MGALELSPRFSVVAAVRLCVIVSRTLLMLPDNPAILDAFLDQTDAHQGPNWQFEF